MKHGIIVCRALGAEQDGFVSYGKFRNFLILLPEAKLREADPSIAWFEAATMVPFGKPDPALHHVLFLLGMTIFCACINSCVSILHRQPDV